MINRSKVHIAGTMGVVGGLLFFFYFSALNPFLRLFFPSIEPGDVGTIKMVFTLITSVCLAGGPLGLLALDTVGSGASKKWGVFGATLSLMGFAGYLTGALYIYAFPEIAFRQMITPASSFLASLGGMIMGVCVLRAQRLVGWRQIVPLAAGLYFLLQFPFQAFFFLGHGKGPNPYLLGGWGLMWALQGTVIRTNTDESQPVNSGFTSIEAR